MRLNWLLFLSQFLHHIFVWLAFFLISQTNETTTNRHHNVSVYSEHTETTRLTRYYCSVKLKYKSVYLYESELVHFRTNQTQCYRVLYFEYSIPQEKESSTLHFTRYAHLYKHRLHSVFNLCYKPTRCTSVMR